MRGSSLIYLIFIRMIHTDEKKWIIRREPLRAILSFMSESSEYQIELTRKMNQGLDMKCHVL